MSTTPTRPVIAMLLYPGLTPLDLVAPHAALAPHADVHLVWKDLDPVISDVGMLITPNTTLADCPVDLDVLFVPGGRDQAGVAQDETVLEFLESRGARARYVTSVCGGSLILGAAGLLVGYRAATHWTGRHTLAAFGAQNVNDRVVIDRNRITGVGSPPGWTSVSRCSRSFSAKTWPAPPSSCWNMTLSRPSRQDHRKPPDRN